MSNSKPDTLAEALASLSELHADQAGIIRTLNDLVDRGTAGTRAALDEMEEAAYAYRAERDLLQLVAGLAASGGRDEPSPMAFVRAAARVLERAPRVEHGAVVLFAEDGKPTVLEAVGVAEEEKIYLDEQVSSGIIAQVRRTGEEVYSEEAYTDGRFEQLASVQALNLRTVLCTPIGGGPGRPVRGALYLENRHRKGAFTEAWRDAMRFLASQLDLQLALLERIRHPHEDATLPFRQAGRYAEFIGTSWYTAQVFGRLDRLIRRDPLPTVLITGETGVGKELVARAIHHHGPRGRRPFVPLNTAELAPNLIEADLFGSLKGAYTGAPERKGLFEEASGGVLFLDEIAELPLEMQAKLLRVLDTKRIRRLGTARERPVDTWVIAATNQDLRQAMDEGRFRRDLYYRLAETTITIPPLRDRPDDVEALFEHYLGEWARAQGRTAPFVSPALMMALRNRRWEGNVREIRSLTDALLAGFEGRILTCDDLRRADEGDGFEAEPQDDFRWEVVKARFERDYLQWAIAHFGPSLAEISAHLGIHRTYLPRLCRKHGIDLNEPSGETPVVR